MITPEQKALIRQAEKMGRSFARASLKIDEASISGEAMTRLREVTTMLREHHKNEFSVTGGFCQGVAEQLRKRR